MNKILKLYRDCSYGYFVIFGNNYESDVTEFENKKWCGIVITDKISVPIHKKISYINYDESGLKNTIDKLNPPCMIHYLRIDDDRYVNILMDFFKKEYDDYYNVYEHGFLKRIPFIDVAYNQQLDTFLKKYNYFYSEKNNLFTHNRYYSL